MSSAKWCALRNFVNIPLPKSKKHLHQRFTKLYCHTKDTCNININSLKEITWYSCGPTVYDQAHIGHARTYVTTDIIRRILEDYFHIRVNFAMGITDIDDKIIHKGRTKGLTQWKDMLPMIRQLENDFFYDMDQLNVKRPNAILRVTDHITDIIQFIQHLEKLGYAYTVSDGVYFNVQKLGDKYGQLCPLPPSNQDNVSENSSSEIQIAHNADTIHNNSSSPHINHNDDHDTYNITTASSSANATTSTITTKRYWRDFALWKFHKPGEPSWNSPWGSGRPGWHIECSAMTQSYFGEYLDIHSGGVDLKFPHHTNEIAQSEAHAGCTHTWVKKWIHTGHMYIEGRKMSKSLKNFITIQEYLRNTDNTYESNALSIDFRMLCLLYKYNATIHFTREQIKIATQYRHKIEHFLNFYYTVENHLSSINISTNTATTSATATATTTTSATTITSNDMNMISSNYHNSSSSFTHMVREYHYKPSIESKALQSLYYTTQQNIYTALYDYDYDTPMVLKELMILMNASSNYGQLILQSSNSSYSSLSSSSSSSSSAESSSTCTVTTSTTTASSITTNDTIANTSNCNHESNMSNNDMYINKIQNNSKYHPLAPLTDSKNYILKMLTIFGVDLSQLHLISPITYSPSYHCQQSHTSQDTTSSSSPSSSSTTTQRNQDKQYQDIINLLVKFRSDIRGKCIPLIKANKKQQIKEKNKNKNKISTQVCITTPTTNEVNSNNTISDKIGTDNSNIESSSINLNEEIERLMQLNTRSIQIIQEIIIRCDQLRNQEIKELGIQIDDLGVEVSVWNKISTNMTPVLKDSSTEQDQIK